MFPSLFGTVCGAVMKVFTTELAKRLHGPDNFVLTVLMRGETMNPFGLETHFGANQPIFCAILSTVVTTGSEDQLGSFLDGVSDGILDNARMICVTAWLQHKMCRLYISRSGSTILSKA